MLLTCLMPQHGEPYNGRARVVLVVAVAVAIVVAFMDFDVVVMHLLSANTTKIPCASNSGSCFVVGPVVVVLLVGGCVVLVVGLFLSFFFSLLLLPLRNLQQ